MDARLEQQWLRRYLDRELAPAELEWFEAYALDKPALLDAIDTDTTLRDGVCALGADVVTDSASADAGTASVAALPPRRRAYAAPAWMGMAASLLLGVGGGWLGHSALRNSAPPDLIANPPRLFFDTMRGSDIAPQQQHAGSLSPYMLIEVAVPPGAANVRVEVDGHAWPLIASSESVVSFVAGRERLNAAKSVLVTYSLSGKPQSRDLRPQLGDSK